MTLTPTRLPVGTRLLAGTKVTLIHTSGARYPVTVHADWTVGDRKIVVAYDLADADGRRPWWATGHDADLAIVSLDAYTIEVGDGPACPPAGELADAVARACATVEGDSNDDEIDALWDALHLALTRWPEVPVQ